MQQLIEQMSQQMPIVFKALNEGFGQTLRLFFVTLAGALPLGLIISFGSMSKFPPLKWLTRMFVGLIRGTPLMIQLLIIFYFPGLVLGKNIWGSGEAGRFTAAAISFIINYAAYFAEIFRSGIMSVDEGQFEAGRSLGFNYLQTMRHIIIPQAFKTVLPTLCNEFIVLIKETSIAGYVGIMDLTKAGDLIRGRTFKAFLPLIAVALIYLALVTVLTWATGKLERRLRRNER
mgnify:CR=1 FL=1